MNSAPRALVALVLACTVALAACSGGGEQDDALPERAREGAELVRSEGCTACHSSDGRSSVGPTWQGLYGSEVELEDGATVIADDEYLTTAIEDPDAQRVKGFRSTMPTRSLSDDEIAAIVAYLREL